MCRVLKFKHHQTIKWLRWVHSNLFFKTSLTILLFMQKHHILYLIYVSIVHTLFNLIFIFFFLSLLRYIVKIRMEVIIFLRAYSNNNIYTCCVVRGTGNLFKIGFCVEYFYGKSIFLIYVMKWNYFCIIMIPRNIGRKKTFSLYQNIVCIL